jgi:CheY-like chemotaxis protein
MAFGGKRQRGFVKDDALTGPIEQRRSKIILAVDDVQENIVMLRGIIELYGYSFLSAASGPECLTLVTRVVPRLILLDVQMPVMSGFETCRRLRENPALRNVPIVFLTASKTTEDVRAGIRAGGNDFIVKPFDPQKLLSRVDHWIGRRLTQ